MFQVEHIRAFAIVMLFALAVGAAGAAGEVSAADNEADSSADSQRVLHAFQRQQLTDVYFSEGANAGDIDGDGRADIVYGPYWFKGPQFTEKHEIYPAEPQPTEGYANNFFSWIYDFDSDGDHDVMSVGLPGSAAVIFENPGPGGLDAHWTAHSVLQGVGNESPQFVNLVGDAHPELVCNRDGRFGYASADWTKPLELWSFHAITEDVKAGRFTHGLGVGDVNGDGRADVLWKNGWYEQPESVAGDPLWTAHTYRFAGPGGADMFAYDVDGDGDNDVITSLAAHEFGLAWYEQVDGDEGITFRPHLIMGSHRSESPYGILFSELHSVALADMDGDGLKDIITGKTYWSHHRQSPMWDAGAVVYWFRLVRADDGVDWIPYRADDDSGIGRQLTVKDVNGDDLPDIVAGGMKGAHVLIHQRAVVKSDEWEAAQPKPYAGPKLPSTDGAQKKRGPRAPIDGPSGRVAGAIEGESLQASASGGEARSQPMGNFAADRWSNNSQLWWTGARPGDTLSLKLPPKAGQVDLELVLTCAKDYGIVQLTLDDQVLGKPIDLYDPEVVTTGVLYFPKLELKPGPHTLSVEILGANPMAVKSYMFGLDYVRMRAEGETFPEPNDGIKATAADGRVLNLDFETGTLDDWIATGEAFAGQPIKGDTVSERRRDMRSAHRGEFWIGGYEKVEDGPTGTLTSVPFKVTHPYASFLANGGPHAETRVELIREDTGEVFYRIAGQQSEMLRQVVVDLRAVAGKNIMIRLVDEHRGGWGHVNFDHFRFHDERPARVTQPLAQLVPDEYPHAGLEAQEAAAAMQVPEGFRVTVSAAEPEVKQPIAMALDDRGRVWVAEAYEYPVRAEGDQGRDRILIFEDSDGDGVFDKRTVFCEGLNLVSGLEVGFGGVWVGAAPYLLFIPDQNGDDVPDGEPQVLLDGWGYQDTHETLNAFIWGPDGWLYGCHGVFTHSRVGKPGTPDEERIPLNAAVWRYHPTRHTFEVFAHGTSNPWGVDFDDYGQSFVTACVIPHLYHIIQGARYQRQAGQHFNQYTYRDIVTIADHLHYLGATPHSGNSKSDAAGGGHAHAGAMIYLGGVWPDEYRNQIFMNNIHGQRLNMDLLNPQGSGYIGSHGPDFLLTGDQASQILNLRYGPDGQAYMIDWYDMQACHRREVEVHDRSNGRIYKISYGDTEPVTVDLTQLSDRELAEQVLETNDWYVRHARKILQHRAAEGAIDLSARERLVEIATTHRDATRRLRAVWALHVTGGLDSSLANTLLADASPYARGWTIQLVMEGLKRDGAETIPTAFLSQFETLAREDDSPVVRLYLASAAQQIPFEQRWTLLSGLTSHAEDAGDHNLPLMYWYAAEPLADVDTERALALGLSAGEKIPLLREFMLRRIGSSDATASLAALVRGLGKAETPDLQLTFLQAIRAALRGQRRVAAPEAWSDVYARISRSESPEVRLHAQALGVTFGDAAAMEAFRELVLTETADTQSRREALDALLAAKDPELVTTLQTLIATPELRETAVRGLAQYDDPRTPEVLLSGYPKFGPGEKRAALSTLCSRAGYGIALLRAIEKDTISGTELTADLVRQLQFLKNEKIDALLEDVWGSVRETAADKVELIAQFKALVQSPAETPADASLGRAVFAKTCMKCHVLYGVGNKVGPDLTGSNRSNLDYLLSNIVDPSAVMAKEYQPSIIVTIDGRLITGLIQEETDKALTVQTADALVIVPKDEIDEQAVSPKSMMPDDQLKLFSDHEVRSLIKYLSGREQVPMLATKDTVALLFNGKNLTGWTGDPELWSVEDGQIVGRTAGLQRNEFLVSDISAADFRLKLEVKLVDNAGNSGIQFRSEADEGSVKGYQADIGAGWWGKLYEEHGRALLWDKSGEEFVRAGEWNSYEIVARGSRIQTLINGNLCVDLDDPEGARRGVFALQLHSGGKTEVRFRNLQLEVFDEQLAATPEVTPSGE